MITYVFTDAEAKTLAEVIAPKLTYSAGDRPLLEFYNALNRPVDPAVQARSDQAMHMFMRDGTPLPESPAACCDGTATESTDCCGGC